MQITSVTIVVVTIAITTIIKMFSEYIWTIGVEGHETFCAFADSIVVDAGGIVPFIRANYMRLVGIFSDKYDTKYATEGHRTYSETLGLRDINEYLDEDGLIKIYYETQDECMVGLFCGDRLKIITSINPEGNTETNPEEGKTADKSLLLVRT